MNEQRVFKALLALYPRSFRQDYGEAMLETFGALRADRAGLAFWLFVCIDVCRSAWREQLDECRCGTRKFVCQWVGVCILGVGVTAVSVNLLGWSFSYLYHPYLEGVSVTPWTYGAFLGAGLGVAQRVALRRRFRIGASWILVSALSAAFGLDLAMMVAGPVAFGAVLGTVVGSGQWLLLRPHTRRAGALSVASALALPAGVLLCATAMHRTLAGMNPIARFTGAPAGVPRFEALIRALYVPRSWPELFVELVLVATAGCIVGAFTARSLATRRAA